MKRLIFGTMIGILASLTVLAQDNGRTIRVNYLHQKTEEFEDETYRYDEFKKGTVAFHDTVFSPVLLNHHRVFDQIHFLNEDGDTLALAHPELLEMVCIGKDTFFFHDKHFLQLITHTGPVRLARKQTLTYIGKEKRGPYGMYSTVASINAAETFADQIVTQRIQRDENLIYELKSVYFLTDRFNNFFLANRKNFLNLFPVRGKTLNRYLREYDLKLTREEDLRQIIGYLQDE